MTRGDLITFLNSTEDRSENAAAAGASAARRRGRLQSRWPTSRAPTEVIAAVIHQPRPGVEVKTVEPDTIDGSILRVSYDMVALSKATDALKGRVRIWVELYPEHAAHSVASIGWRLTEYTEIQLPDLLSAVNKSEDLAQAS